MNHTMIASFLDELEKIAASDKAPVAPRTSAPSPAPAARLAPTPVAKPPTTPMPVTKSPVPQNSSAAAGTSLGSFMGPGKAQTMLGAQMAQRRSQAGRALKMPQPASNLKPVAPTLPDQPASPRPRTAVPMQRTPSVRNQASLPSRQSLGIPSASPF
jgi:hypothetical protein